MPVPNYYNASGIASLIAQGLGGGMMGANQGYEQGLVLAQKAAELKAQKDYQDRMTAIAQQQADTNAKWKENEFNLGRALEEKKAAELGMDISGITRPGEISKYQNIVMPERMQIKPSETWTAQAPSKPSFDMGANNVLAFDQPAESRKAELSMDKNILGDYAYQKPAELENKETVSPQVQAIRDMAAKGAENMAANMALKEHLQYGKNITEVNKAKILADARVIASSIAAEPNKMVAKQKQALLDSAMQDAADSGVPVGEIYAKYEKMGKFPPSGSDSFKIGIADIDKQMQQINQRMINIQKTAKFSEGVTDQKAKEMFKPFESEYNDLKDKYDKLAKQRHGMITGVSINKAKFGEDF